ncbi:hypothetical protein PR001_g32580, partial [Phytophthora rubi]
AAPHLDRHGAGTFSAASDDNANQTRKQHMQTQIQTFALSVDPFAIHTSFANPVQLIVSLAAKTIFGARGDGVALCAALHAICYVQKTEMLGDQELVLSTHKNHPPTTAQVVRHHCTVSAMVFSPCTRAQSDIKTRCPTYENVKYYAAQ